MNLTCRSCGSALSRTVLDLGDQPLANSYPQSAEECATEQRYPLHVRVCERCWLVQLPEVVSPEEIFRDYAYFSSYSASWTEHMRDFAVGAIERWALDEDSLVVEAASNDGYLLRHFADRSVPVLGIEPALNVAEHAASLGIPTRAEFFTEELGSTLRDEGRSADLLVGNNVLAHVPDINDFVAGVHRLLKPEGVASFEFPHLIEMLRLAAFDTIYHEHFSYLSLLSVEAVLRRHGLRAIDVELLATHGGSYRLTACHDSASHTATPRVAAQRRAEETLGLGSVDAYVGFADRSQARAAGVIEFLRDASRQGRRVAAYGAAAKGNTLLNFCGIGTGEIPYVVDRSPHKQGRFLPGSHLPVRDPEVLFTDRPDELLLLAWNLADEIRGQVGPRCDWGMRFVTTAPEIRALA